MKFSKPSRDGLPPFLRWAGSKRKSIERLRAYWLAANASRYIEPFVGSASLFFAVAPQRAILSDQNEDLVSTYNTIKTGSVYVARNLRALPRDKSTYLKVRKQEPEKLSKYQAAARFIYLNRLCFNGLYRTNLAGQFNVPYGGWKSGPLPDYEQLKLYSDALQGAKVIAADFERVVTTHVRKNDFVYLDPPYFVSTKRIFREYGPTMFSEGDLARLKRTLKYIDQAGAHFLLSYHDCAEIRDGIGQWLRDRISVVRNIAGFVEDRRIGEELIFSNLSNVPAYT